MRPHSSTFENRERIFYVASAGLFVILTFAGFSRSYYLKPLFGTPELTAIAHLHGVAFSLWVLFFFVQVFLVAARRTDLHRRLGKAGAGLAAAVLLLGSVMTFISVKSGYAAGKPGMDALFLNALMNLALFTVLCAAGLYFRHKKETHKRLMTLSMLAVILPALARLPYAMSYMGWLVIGFSVAGIVHDAIVFRRIHLANVLGGALILTTTPLRFMIAPTPAWHNFVESLVR